MTLNPVCDNVETKQGVPLTVTGVAQVKIMKDEKFLEIAAEQFLGKKEDEITDTILQTLEGHLRAILGTLTVGGLQGPGPVRQPGARHRQARRGQDGHRDPLLHHQGRVRQRGLSLLTRQVPDRRCQEGRR